MSPPHIAARDADPALAGSLPIDLRRRRDDDDDDGPDPEPDPDAPVQPSVPEIAFQLRDPRAAGPDCLDASFEAQIAAGVRSALRTELPNAEVRVDCVEHGSRAATTVGVWSIAATSERVQEARALGLRQLDLLEDSEDIGIFVNASFIRRRVAEAFADVPKRYSPSGRPAADGPIHLTGHTVRFLPPQRVSLEIRGYDERPWPDVSFTITVVDLIAREGSKVVCHTSEPELDVDLSWLNAVTFAATALVAAFTPLHLAIQDLRDVLAAHPFGDHEVPAIAGPGCAIVLTFFQEEVALPGGRKLLIFYVRAPVTAGGMFAAGAFLPAARDPEVSIHGPTRLVATVGAPGAVHATYRVTGSDLRGDVSIRWSPSAGVAVQPTLPSTSVAWSRPSGDAGDVVRRTLSVRVRDEDGLEASARLDVEIHLVAPDPEPSICEKKPWLPQCR